MKFKILGIRLYPFLLLPLLFLLLGIMPDAYACYWRIIGTIRYNNTFDSCPVDNTRVRISARWSSGCIGNCPWNTINWGEDVTDSNGNFSVTSNVPFAAGEDCSRARDIRIELYDPFSSSSWSQVAIVTISGATPHGVSGSGASELHTFNLATQTTSSDRFACETELVPVEDSNSSSNGTGNDNFSGSHQAEPVPLCSLAALPHGVPKPDLTFEHNEEIASQEGVNGVVEMPREGEEDNPYALQSRYNVKNNGPGNYSGRGRCKASVKKTILAPRETGGFYPERNYYKTLSDAINAGSSIVYTEDSGYLPGGISENPQEDYLPPWAWITFRLDHENKVQETNENNNSVTICYDVINHTVYPSGQGGPCTQGMPSPSKDHKPKGKSMEAAKSVKTKSSGGQSSKPSSKKSPTSQTRDSAIQKR